MGQKSHSPRRNRRPGRRTTRLIGGVFLVLALIGLATLATFGYRAIHGLLNNTSEKMRIERFLTPVVMFDPVPYASVQEASSDTILLTCIWAALLDESAQTYPQDDMGMVILPGPDVEYQAHRLYGDAALISHRTVDDYENIYMYDPDVNAYRIPVVAKVAYIPKVDHIIKSGDVLTVRVGYVPPGSSWLTGFNQEATPSPDKYMVYKLKKSRGNYTILAVDDDNGGLNFS
jgi:hypothetical protein